MQACAWSSELPQLQAEVASMQTTWHPHARNWDNFGHDFSVCLFYLSNSSYSYLSFVYVINVYGDPVLKKKDEPTLNGKSCIWI